MGTSFGIDKCANQEKSSPEEKTKEPGKSSLSTSPAKTSQTSEQDPKLKQTVESCQKAIGSVATSGRYHRLPKKVEQDYDISTKVLGSGYNGDVHLATRKKGSGASTAALQKFAVKEFKMKSGANDKKEEIQRECEIFLQMDHPHVARLADVYEDESRLILVMECMEGGELFDRVIEKKRFSSADAKKAAYQMTFALNYLHSHGIVHRDIKLENWLYESKDTDHLKLIDFGFSIHPDGKMKASCGTLSYVAPEVLAQSYTSKCDMWSLGVVLFILLGGYMPFSGSDQEQKTKIKAGTIVYKEQKWCNVDKDARNFIENLLVVDPSKRMSAEDALKHPWLANIDTLPEASHDVTDSADVASSMVEFAQASKFRRTCMLAMAWSLTNEERSKVRQAFMQMDHEKHGTITIKDFKKVIEEHFDMNDAKIQEAFDAIDAAHNHEIQYSEFLAAMVSSRIGLHDDLVTAAFRRFDVDNSGYIDASNLQSVLCDASDAEIKEMMNEVDANHDGKISYEEFIDYLKRKDEHQETVHSLIDKEVASSGKGQRRKLSSKS